MSHKKPHYCHTYYLEEFIQTDKLRNAIQIGTRILRDIDQVEPFDAIAFSGVSGMLIGPSLALALDKTMLCVRKKDKNCHSSHLVEGDFGAKRYVIVDDLISTGETVGRIIDSINEAAEELAKYLTGSSAPECIGVLELYYIVRGSKPRELTRPVHGKTQHGYGYGSNYMYSADVPEKRTQAI